MNSIGPENLSDVENLPSPFIAEISKMKMNLSDGIDSVITGMPKSLDPYVEARRDLERAFLARMPKRISGMFTDVYMKMET